MAPPLILLTEPDITFGKFLTEKLQQSGFSVILSVSSHESLQIARQYDITLVAVSENARDIHFKDFKNICNIHDANIKIINYESTIKPECLVERIAKIILTTEIPINILQCGPITLDLQNKFVFIGNFLYTLTGEEWGLLEYLVRYKNRLVTFVMINSVVFPRDPKSFKRIRNIILSVKEKLSRDDKTVRDLFSLGNIGIGLMITEK